MTKSELDHAQQEMKARVQNEGKPKPTHRAKGNELWREEHFLIPKLHDMWGYDAETIRRAIHADPYFLANVMKYGEGETRNKRAYFTYSVPESIAARLHAKLCSNR